VGRLASAYTQLILINMLTAVLIVTGLFGAPLFPTVPGALGAGALLYVRHRVCRRR
jgi:hypothetical protein